MEQLGCLGETDQGGGPGDRGAQHQQEHGDQAVEKPFESGKRERHDTHLSVLNLRGSGGVLLCERC